MIRVSCFGIAKCKFLWQPMFSKDTVALEFVLIIILSLTAQFSFILSYKYIFLQLVDIDSFK